MSGIKEIAKRLDLTEATVSYVLNGRHHKVSAATRQRVQEMARALGYAPNPAARALASGRSGNIGFVSRHHDNALYTALFEEIAIAVDERGGNLVTCVTGRDMRHRGQEHLLHARLVDGIIAVPYALPHLDAPDSPWMRRPVVFLLGKREDRRAPSVGFDDADGAAQVARHLWGLGHRRLLFLQGLGVNREVSGMGRERLEYLRDAWRGLGGDPDTQIAESCGYANAGGGRAAVEPLLTNGFPFTAVVAYDDQMAIGAMTALRTRGLRIPGDVSVVGWNDLDDTPAHLYPSLTSVRTSPAALARAAVELLYRQIKPPESEADTPVAGDTRVRVAVELIPRASTRAR